jgi:UDP-N-acetylmuramoyl-tripeptide--D-alanyl-D-alanine ligase
MGMNHFGEIAYLAGIAKPDVAAIINIGTMHIEHLGSQEGILKAKLEILEGMSADGKVLLNGDDRLLWNYGKTAAEPITYFGASNSECPVRAADISEQDGTLRMTVQWQKGSFPLELPLEGMHYVSDAMAAVAVGLSMGVTPQQIAERLASFRNMAGRQEILEARGCTIIKDCYNAGPESMAAALTVLGNRPGRHIAVLGDMLELGNNTQAEHYRVGRIAAEKTQILLSYGPNADRVISGAITGGMTTVAAKAYPSHEAMAKALKRLSRQGDVILFKGCHGMHMERVLELFLKEDT